MYICMYSQLKIYFAQQFNFLMVFNVDNGKYIKHKLHNTESDNKLLILQI